MSLPDIKQQYGPFAGIFIRIELKEDSGTIYSVIAEREDGQELWVQDLKGDLYCYPPRFVAIGESIFIALGTIIFSGSLSLGGLREFEIARDIELFITFLGSTRDGTLVIVDEMTVFVVELRNMLVSRIDCKDLVVSVSSFDGIKITVDHSDGTKRVIPVVGVSKEA